ncbi:MAG TPA: hypothetical protein VFJ06_01685 [Halococcus sp.]|nr:hypothetical protein [Halococcus sp.]
MSTGDSYEDVRELAREVAATDDLSEFDWSLLYSWHFPSFASWESDFDRLVEQSDKSRDDLVAEFRYSYTEFREQSNGGHG